MKTAIVVVLLVLICVVLVFTNPSMEDHEQWIYDAYKSSTAEEELTGFLERLGADVAKSLNVAPFSYNDYLLFSTVSLNGKIVSVGLFNHVFIVGGID